MSIFVASTPAAEPKSPVVEKAALLLAGIVIVLVLSQLFSFEKFPEVIQALALPGVGDGYSVLIAALIVVAEVLMVPFLLRMRLIPVMRIASMVAGWFVALWWIFVTLWQNLLPTGPADAAFLGATVSAPVGWWAVCLMLGMGVLVVWVSWGLWPLRRVVK